MSFLILNVLKISFGVLLLLNPGETINSLYEGDYDPTQVSSSIGINIQEQELKSSGYRAIKRYNDGFVAAGSEGRIDWISTSGKIVKEKKIAGENFNCLLSDIKETIVAGDNGTILISSDEGTFRKINSGTNKNISSLVLFKGNIIAGTNDKGIILCEGMDSLRHIYLAVKGNIVSLSSRTSDCFGVTDQGEIIHTTDGINWNIFDFNQVYKGFYRSCYFTKILVTEKNIVITGKRDDDSPVIMLSTLGNVWNERDLIYTDENGMQSFLTDLPKDIFYDDLHDELYLICNKGKLMKLSSCPHCNKLRLLPAENLTGISGNSETLMIVGDNFLIETINPEW